MKFTGPGCLGGVCVMLKKIALVLLAVLTLSVGFVAVKFIIPMYTALDMVGPGSAPRDLALQDDSRVEAPFGNAHSALVEGRPFSENMAAGGAKLYWGRVTFAYNREY